MYLLEETEEAREIRQNLKNLLASNDEAKIALGLQMLEAGGFHSELEPTFFVMLFAKMFHSASQKWGKFYGIKARLMKIDSDTKEIECEFMGEKMACKVSGFNAMVAGNNKYSLTLAPPTRIKHLDVCVKI